MSELNRAERRDHLVAVTLTTLQPALRGAMADALNMAELSARKEAYCELAIWLRNAARNARERSLLDEAAAFERAAEWMEGRL